MSHLTLEERFNQLVSLLSSGPTLIQGKSINSELLFDVLIAVYFECQRYVCQLLPLFPPSLMTPSSLSDRVIATSRNKQQQRFCEFIKPFLDLIFDLHLKVIDFEQLKIIGRGAFGQVALVKVRFINGLAAGEATALVVDSRHLSDNNDDSHLITGERKWKHLCDENTEQD